MKRTISFLLLALMLCSSLLVSCGGGDTTADNSGETTAAAETTVAETEDPLADNLPETDFEGKEFRMYARKFDSTDEVKYAYAEVEDGDVINDAVFNANKTVEERFNVDITMTGYETQINTANNSIGNSILAGDDAFDLFSSHDRTMAQFSLAGYLINVNDLPHLDYSKPWWQQKSIDSLTISDTMFLISNSLSYCTVRQSAMVYFNKAKATDYGFESFYDVVNDGNWTLDKMTEYAKDIYEDLNGNGEADDEDFYGFIGDSQAYRIIESFGVTSYRSDPEKILVIDTDNEKTHTFIEKYYKLCYESVGGLMVSDSNEPRKRFENELTLFYFGTLGNAVEYLRYTDVEFGYLPMPKLTDIQDTYITGCNDVPYGVPVTNGDLEMTGIMVEAMSAEGYKQIQPAYFEVALKQKFTTDEESIQMLDIIAANRVLDFGYLYCGSNKLCRPITYLLAPSNPSTDYASFYAANIEAEQANVDAIIEAFQNIM